MAAKTKTLEDLFHEYFRKDIYFAEKQISKGSSQVGERCGGPSKGPNHDAAMRIGSEAPR